MLSIKKLGSYYEGALIIARRRGGKIPPLLLPKGGYVGRCRL